MRFVEEPLFMEHCFFALVCVTLFLAPGVSVGYFFPSFLVDSTVSLGLVPLSLWFVFLIIKYGWRSMLLANMSLPISMLILFACFALINSLFQSDRVGQLMALQWFLYCCMSAFVFAGYLSRIRESLAAVLLIKGLTVVAVIIAVGGLISLFTGPIYAFQTINNIGRIWCGLYLPQAVGFGVNANIVAGLFAFFILFVALFFTASRMVRAVILAVMLSSLLATLSRSGLLSFLVALMSSILLLLYMRITRCVCFSDLKDVVVALGGGMVLSALVVSAFFVLQPAAYDSVRYGLGLSRVGICKDQSMPATSTPATSTPATSTPATSTPAIVLERLESTEGMRLQIWTRAVRRFLNSSVSHQFVGFGWGKEGVYGSDSFGVKLFITVHSSYLAILLDNGLIGIVFLSITFILALLRSFQVACEGYKEGLFGFSFLLAFLCLNITETYIFGMQYVVLLVFSLVLIEVRPFDRHRCDDVRTQGLEKLILNKDNIIDRI